MPQFPAVLDLSSLNGSNGFQISGEATLNLSGASVASAGDINGDGFDDVIIGAMFADPDSNYSGGSYVVFGKASGFAANLNLSTLDGTTGFKISGVAEHDLTGGSVASAGDVNGDGFDDIVVGANGADAYGNNASGESYVVFGMASGFAGNLSPSDLDGKNGFRINGEAAGDSSGGSVASAGDINGDGFDDIIVGANGADGQLPNGANGGASYVVFGSGSGFPADVGLFLLDGKIGFQISGEYNGDGTGTSVASAGDVNGDGFDDLIIGAPGKNDGGNDSGASYVVFGKASGFSANLSLSTLDGTNGFQINGEAAGDHSGRSVASAGDVNGDGFADIFVGAQTISGTCYVLFGQPSGFTANFGLSALDGTNGFQINGEAAGDRSGYGVSSAGDVNGDGFADMIVSAYFADAPGAKSGASYVVFGKASGFTSELDLSTLDGSNGFKINGEAAGDYSGKSVASAGDVNGDGFDDLVIGATGADPHGAASGTSYVVFGHRALTSVTVTGTDIAQRINGGFGDDTLDGLDGNDTLIGWEGDDTISGSAGKDTINGGIGNDVMSGGTGNDLFQVSRGEDEMDGGSGSDTIDFSALGSRKVNINLLSGTFTYPSGVKEQTFVSIENVTGAAGDDTITGSKLKNALVGGAGADVLNGGDRADTLSGGTGADTFVFNAALKSSNIDSIVDFSHADDTFAIENAVFKGLGEGILATGAFKLIASADSIKGVDDTDRILYDKVHGDVYFDRDGSADHYHRVLFAHVKDGIRVDHTDFHII